MRRTVLWMKSFGIVRPHSIILFGILRIPHFVYHKGKYVNSDWFADQWDERSVLGHAQFHKGRMKGDDPEIDTAQTPKRFERRLVLLKKTLQTFTDSIPNKIGQLGRVTCRPFEQKIHQGEKGSFMKL